VQTFPLKAAEAYKKSSVLKDLVLKSVSGVSLGQKSGKLSQVSTSYSAAAKLLGTAPR